MCETIKIQIPVPAVVKYHTQESWNGKFNKDGTQKMVITYQCCIDVLGRRYYGHGKTKSVSLKDAKSDII